MKECKEESKSERREQESASERERAEQEKRRVETRGRATGVPEVGAFRYGHDGNRSAAKYQQFCLLVYVLCSVHRVRIVLDFTADCGRYH